MIRPYEEVLSYTVDEHSGLVTVTTSRSFIKAKKIIITPGAFVNNVIRQWNITVNLDIWELPIFGFNVLKPQTNIPTWLYMGSDEKQLFYGYPVSKQNDYLVVSPEFVFKTIKDPSQRSDFVSPDYLRDCQTLVSHLFSYLDQNNYKSLEQTCIVGRLHDDGFVIDYLPDLSPQYPNQFIIGFGGWAFKFSPLIGETLAEMAIFGYTTINISAFSINRPGVLLQNQTSIITQPTFWDLQKILMVSIGLIVVIIMVIGIIKIVKWYKKNRSPLQLGPTTPILVQPVTAARTTNNKLSINI
jgi:sarcosine oxidase